ncbi:hypothetical protein [Streptomyces alanosinicus]|uniref:Helix-turn-helix domain-containing protein n=1 Tax=Streptomyces alanosinicus TaxID=68171 RepID=A0A918INH4_9ACTN|nr:hypothetical protein [Streptomyces alanosinicus]GGW23944.1 hypothetical protein GCM10010339_93710 [Streptomyces alanosinicus]
MTSSYIPGPPTDEPVTISRHVLQLLALVDISPTGRRVLDMFLALQDPDTGTAHISQDEMCAALGAAKPAVNRGFRELRQCGLAWLHKRGEHQLHPLITGGRLATTATPIPDIKAGDPQRLTEQRRQRFAAQTANLPHTA